jgi:hypothetical protein
VGRGESLEQGDGRFIIVRRREVATEGGRRWLAGLQPGEDVGGARRPRPRPRPARRNNPQALDHELARDLWDRSAELVGADLDPVRS